MIKKTLAISLSLSIYASSAFLVFGQTTSAPAPSRTANPAPAPPATSRTIRQPAPPTPEPTMKNLMDLLNKLFAKIDILEKKIDSMGNGIIPLPVPGPFPLPIPKSEPEPAPITCSSGDRLVLKGEYCARDIAKRVYPLGSPDKSITFSEYLKTKRGLTMGCADSLLILESDGITFSCDKSGPGVIYSKDQWKEYNWGSYTSFIDPNTSQFDIDAAKKVVESCPKNTKTQMSWDYRGLPVSCTAGQSVSNPNPTTNTGATTGGYSSYGQSYTATERECMISKIVSAGGTRIEGEAVVADMETCRTGSCGQMSAERNAAMSKWGSTVSSCQYGGAGYPSSGYSGGSDYAGSATSCPCWNSSGFCPSTTWAENLNWCVGWFQGQQLCAKQDGTHLDKAKYTPSCPAGASAGGYSGGGYSGNSYSGTSSGSSCPSDIGTLLGSGCHLMYTWSDGTNIYCDGPMTNHVKGPQPTVKLSGCPSSPSSAGIYRPSLLSSIIYLFSR